MAPQESSSVVQIGEWTVHPALDSISRGTETRKLEPRTMQLLLCLANSAGEVVGVDRLLTEVWAGVVVEPASVYQAVSQLRKILGDVDPKPSYIATVPRKGYRLIAPVRCSTALPDTPQAPVMLRRTATPRRVWVVAGAFVALALAAAYLVGDKVWLSKRITVKGETPAASVVVSDRSIAVLPFVDMSEKKDQEYFADGMAEELINHLSRITGLKVIARTSSFQFKGKNEEVRSMAGKLGVAHLLEGSIRKAGQELRVSTQLIRASDGVQLWSESYDRALADIFRVQDEISERVATALNATFAAIDPPLGQESSVEAYNLVLEGNYYRARRTKDNVEKAIQIYKQAIDLAPNYALAWARLASAYLTLAEASATPSAEYNAKILAALDQSLRLDPNLVWAYYTRAGYEGAINWNWVAVQADLERMRTLDPHNSYLLPIGLGDMALVSGHLAEAVEHYKGTLERNPLDPRPLQAMTVALCAWDRLQECLQYRMKLQQLYPDLAGINSFVGITYLLLGKFPEALEASEKEPEQDRRLVVKALVYTAMGKRAESGESLRTLEDSFPINDVYEIAQIHAYRGEADAAFDWLERSFRMHNSKVIFVKTDPLLRTLRGDRRFQTLLVKLRLPT